MPYVVFRKRSEFDPQKLRFRKRKNLWDVRYKEHEDKKSAAVYLQTPALELSHFEEDKRNYYLICKVSNEQSRFWDLIQNLEMAVVEEMSADSESWGFGVDAPLAYIETHFTPTLKMSSSNYDYSLHLKIPKGDEVYVFDQDKTPLDLSLLNEGYQLKLLLMLDGVALKNNSYSLKFIPQQMQTEIPREVWDPPTKTEDVPEGECLISESEEEVSVYPEENLGKYSHIPREQVYHYSDDEERRSGGGHQDESEPEQESEPEDVESEQDEELEPEHVESEQDEESEPKHDEPEEQKEQEEEEEEPEKQSEHDEVEQPQDESEHKDDEPEAEPKPEPRKARKNRRRTEESEVQSPLDEQEVKSESSRKKTSRRQKE